MSKKYIIANTFIFFFVSSFIVTVFNSIETSATLVGFAFIAYWYSLVVGYTSGENHKGENKHVKR